MAQLWAVSFYNSKAWKDLRQQLIIEAGYKCSKCGKSYLLEPWQLVGHHKMELTPENVDNVSIALNKDNIEVICKRCHDMVHNRYGFNGQRKVYLVYGAPCSGKTTFVTQVAERGDLIVDINEISHAISGCVLYDKPEKLNRQVYAIRDLLIDHIKTRSGQWSTAFLIGGYPHKLQRENLAIKLNAELVFIAVSKEEAKLRAKIDRQNLFKQYEIYIEKYFSEFQAADTPHIDQD